MRKAVRPCSFGPAAARRTTPGSRAHAINDNRNRETVLEILHERRERGALVA
jgi:hypothetical protein